MSEKKPFISPEWEKYLTNTLSSERMQALYDFVYNEKQAGKNIYPAWSLVFNALNSTAPNQVRVVILGQDPYHGAGQAHGLSFSVERGIKVPPSLRNMYKELSTDVGFKIPSHGNLTEWAEQGVLLLNSVLSVEEGKAASHKNKGWEWFTDQVIEVIDQHCENVVFILWGAYAQKKGRAIDQQRHLVLSSVHPSPLSAHRGFFGCRHFSRANSYLKENGLAQIDWQIN